MTRAVTRALTRRTRRRGLVAALLTAASLAACTGNTDNDVEAQRTPVVAPSVAMTTAASVMEQAATARVDATPAGEAARAEVYAGPALESADAFAKALAVKTPAEKADAELSADVTVLAVSAAPTVPQQILVQGSREKTGDAVLVLLQAEKAGAPFKIVAETPMLPQAKLDALDPTTSGSAPLDDTSGLVAAPKEVVEAFAASIAFPDPKASNLIAADPLSDQVRSSATAQAKALAAGGVFTQTHTPDEILGGMKLKDGKGAVVFAHLVRDDSIAMRTPMKLTPAKDVTAITGVKLITTEAELTSNEIVAFVIPETGSARVIASWEQLVSGSGR
jgi:hypothetical protein